MEVALFAFADDGTASILGHTRYPDIVRVVQIHLAQEKRFAAARIENGARKKKKPKKKSIIEIT